MIKKGASAPVGIKNSWKYEKDLIILNILHRRFSRYKEYVGELGDNLTCYKIFNFKSKPYLIQAVFDDKTNYETINYYDLNWNKLDLRQNFPNNDNDMPKPKNLDKMLELSEKLAQEFPYFVRVDFYEFGDKVLFSEFTFYSDNGMAKFNPPEWDKKLGDLIDLPLN